jgi:hypothetical protein
MSRKCLGFHVEAVGATCREWARLVESGASRNVSDHRPPDLAAARRWHDVADAAAAYDPASLRGQRITLAALLGRGYWIYGSKESRSRGWHGESDDNLGLARAVYEPAYSLRRSPYRRGLPFRRRRGILDDILRHVLADPDDSTEIWSWSTDWSHYFDDGHEWWGAACWTVATSRRDIVTILASDTD